MKIYDILKTKLGQIKNPTILELGAYDGQDTEWFLNNLINPRIICVEPDLRNIPKIKKRLGTNITLIEAAVGSYDGETDFYMSDCNNGHEWTYSSSIRKPTGHLIQWPEVTFKEVSKVQIKTLDTISLLAGISNVDLIWADTQGAEGDIISGGKKTLHNTKYLYTEVSTDLRWYEEQLLQSEILALLPDWEIQYNDNDMNILLYNLHMEIIKPKEIKCYP